jgi:hypothetical protein
MVYRIAAREMEQATKFVTISRDIRCSAGERHLPFQDQLTALTAR